MGETRFKLATARSFYRLMSRLSNIDLQQDAGDFRLMDRRALDALLSMRERSRYLRGMTVWVGFTHAAVPYEREARAGGETKYTLARMVRFSLDAISSFSHLPLQAATVLGFVFSIVAFLAIPVVVALKTGGRLPARLHHDHGGGAAAGRHPADRGGDHRRVRGTHLRRGQAPPAVRGPWPSQRRGRGRGGRVRAGAGLHLVIAVAADERTGVAEAVVSELRRRGHEVSLHGALTDGERDDWAWASEAAAREVAEGRAEQAVVCCWTGTGASIAANKVAGVRAALCVDGPTAAGARRWNDANVLALSLRSTSEAVLEEILESWFESAASEKADDRANVEHVAEIEGAGA